MQLNQKFDKTCKSVNYHPETKNFQINTKMKIQLHHFLDNTESLKVKGL